MFRTQLKLEFNCRSHYTKLISLEFILLFLRSKFQNIILKEKRKRKPEPSHRNSFPTDRSTLKSTDRPEEANVFLIRAGHLGARFQSDDRQGVRVIKYCQLRKVTCRRAGPF